MSAYEEVYPRVRGPYYVPNYEGAKTSERREPSVTITLDQGAFHATWELLESEARHRYPTREVYAHVRALLRSVESFRQAYYGPAGSRPVLPGMEHNGLSPKSQPQEAPQADAEPAPKKKTFKRPGAPQASEQPKKTFKRPAAPSAAAPTKKYRRRVSGQQ